VSAKKRKQEKDDSTTVAQTMQLVRWDYQPADDDGTFKVPAGTFFQEFPWEGPGQPEAGEPKSRSRKKKKE
jgi:hypothetical protein